MGIRGLSSYFDNREAFFQTVSLEKTDIIIDGNNLRYALYNQCPGTNHAFGGDYDKYYRYVRDYFQTMLNCSISPMVVFDGGYDVSEIKMRTVKLRARDQIRNCLYSYPTNQQKVQVYPLLGKQIFFDVLTDLNIECLQTSFEADQVIAEMAMQRGCPVFSNDSDFFVFSVDFVRLDSVDILASKSEGKLVCDLFNRSKFLKHYNIANPEMLHLLASLIGNDYIPPSVFDVIFSNIKLPKKSRNLSQRHRRIHGLITWLSKQSVVDTALDRLLGHFQQKDRARLKIKVLLSLEVYSGSGQGLQKETLSDSSPLPAWLRQDFKACRLPNWVMDVIHRKKLLLHSQVECKEMESAHTYSFALLQKIVSLLNCDEDAVIIQSRVYKYLGTLFVLDPPFTDISGLDIAERKQMLLSCLHSEDGPDRPDPVDQVELDGDLAGMMELVYAWSGVQPVTIGHLYALLLCRWILTEIDPHTNSIRSEKQIQQKLNSPDTSPDLKPFLQTMARYAQHFHMDTSLHTSNKKFVREWVHSVSVFQSLNHCTNVLNTLLGRVLQLPRADKFLNGTFVYNMIALCHKRPDTVQGTHLPPAENAAFLCTLQLFKDRLGNRLSEINAKRPKKKRTANKVSPEQTNLDEKEVISDGLISSDGDDPLLNKSDCESATFFDSGNRFSVLIG